WKKSVDLATNIKLGTRVRLLEEGTLGRIVWANASSVKIEWDDGKKVTWKRVELGIKGVAVSDAGEDGAGGESGRGGPGQVFHRAGSSARRWESVRGLWHASGDDARLVASQGRLLN